MKRLLPILLFALLTFLAFNRHSQSGYHNYHSEIWADKAGYHVYLPALFIYELDGTKFPQHIDSLTGNGFTLQKNGKVFTKYAYGTALMQAPFFALAHLAAPLVNQPKTGYSPIYHWAINVAAAFYATLGLYLLYLFLGTRFNKMSAFWSCTLLLLGSNLYFYTVTDGGMSHVYSFALFAITLWFMQKVKVFESKSSVKNVIKLGILSGLLVAIRPTNALFLAFTPFAFTTSWDVLIQKISHLATGRNIAIMLSCIFLLISPQLLYNYYLHETFWYYSYQEEGFNWTSPQILYTWFSPNNGLFLYGSLYLLILPLVIKQSINTSYNWWYLLFFIGISYVFSCWWDWAFGCSFGQRNFAEYLVVFSIPLTQFIYQLRLGNLLPKLLFGITAFAIVFLNLQLTYAYDQCFYGENNWDWSFYLHLLTNAW